MKATRADVMEVLCPIFAGDISTIFSGIQVGTESDSDMVVFARIYIWDAEVAQLFSRAVMKLATKHDEVYTPVILTEKYAAMYMANSGFTELGETKKERFPIEIGWTPEQVVVYNTAGDTLGKTSYEELEDFCRGCLGEILQRGKSVYKES